MILLKSYVNDENPKVFSISAADLDGDGEVSAKDAVELSWYLMNQVKTFSYEMDIDSDEDGLCNYIEKEFLKTDYLKKDTEVIKKAQTTKALELILEVSIPDSIYEEMLSLVD